MKMMFSKSACAMGLAAMMMAGPALAAYPDKAIELVVPYAAGGATDVIARMVGSELSGKLGQSIVTVNKPGAGTTIAAAEMARAKPDGYKLYMTTAAHTISASLYKKLNYDPIADFAPLALVARIPIVLVVAPKLQVKTLTEYLAYAKSNSNGVSVGSPGNGSPQHLTQALFKERTGANLLHIPYRGDAPLITDLLAGQVESAFITLSAALPHIQSGKLRGIALANPVRIPAIADVPTMAEAGLKDFNAATWFGFFGPAGIPDDVQQTFFKATEAIVGTPEFKGRIDTMGGEVVNIGPQAFRDYVKQEAAQWSKAVQASGASVD